ncbi:hypothetical protein VPH35_021198 [Triticum aestivum]
MLVNSGQTISHTTTHILPRTWPHNPHTCLAGFLYNGQILPVHFPYHANILVPDKSQMVVGHWSDNGQVLGPPLLMLRAASFDPGALRSTRRLYLRCSPASPPPSALALGAAAGCAPRAHRLPRWPRPDYLRLRVDAPSSPSRLAAAPAAAPCPWRASEHPPATAPPLDTCSTPAGFSRLARAAPFAPALTGHCWPRLASRASSRPPAGPRPAVSFPARAELSTPRLRLLVGSPPSRRPLPHASQLRPVLPPSPVAGALLPPGLPACWLRPPVQSTAAAPLSGSGSRAPGRSPRRLRLPSTRPQPRPSPAPAPEHPATAAPLAGSGSLAPGHCSAPRRLRLPSTRLGCSTRRLWLLRTRPLPRSSPAPGPGRPRSTGFCRVPLWPAAPAGERPVAHLALVEKDKEKKERRVRLPAWSRTEREKKERKGFPADRVESDTMKKKREKKKTEGPTAQMPK